MKKYKTRLYGVSAKSKPEEVFKSLAYLVALIFCLSQCSGEPEKTLSNKPKLMLLTSDYTEIVLFSAKVPGYWAKQVSDGEEFFLSTQVRSYEKGDKVEVEGPFGNATAAVYNDETGIYQSEYPTNILVEWKIAKYLAQKNVQPASKKA